MAQPVLRALRRGHRAAAPLACAVWLGLALPAPAAPTEMIVTGGCTLEDAFTAANFGAASGGCPAGSGTDTIHLTEDLAAPSPPVSLHVKRQITLKGHGRALTEWSVIVDDGATLEARSVRFIDSFLATASTGALELKSCTVRGSDLLHAIRNFGNMTLSDTTVTDVDAGDESAIDNTASGTMTIERSRITDNRTSGSGGAVTNAGILTVRQSLFFGNRSADGPFSGGSGAIRNSGQLTIDLSTFANNRAEGIHASGGAIGSSGSLRIDRSTFSDNAAVASSGGARGGAISVAGEFAVADSTFSGNEATGVTNAWGGAIAAVNGGGVSASTIFGNRVTGGGTLLGGGLFNLFTDPSDPLEALGLASTILENNTIDNCGGGAYWDYGGNRGCLGHPAVTNIDPVLRNNGGPTHTHALLPGSNAIGAGASCGLIDQRVARRDAGCDIGAFELGGCQDDLHEMAMSYAQDGSCNNATPIDAEGLTQAHRHCDPDWVRFPAAPGRHYRVETSRLTGGADTWIWAAGGSNGCAYFIDADDNGGGGLASRLDLTATAADPVIAVLVLDAANAYAAGKGYDITVTCTSGCICPRASTLNLTSAMVSGAEVHEVCDTVTLGPSYTIETGGILILGAGYEVALGDGFSVESGGSLTIELDPDLRPPLGL